MHIKKLLPSILGLTAILTLGAALYVNVNKTPVEADAYQVDTNFAPYTYTGTYYSDNDVDFDAGDGMDGELRKKLTTVIRPKDFVEYSAGLSTHLQQADEDQNDTDNMVLFYTRDSVKKHGATDWNREHVWPKSLSKKNWGTDKGGTDILHLRPTYNQPNSDRSSHPFGNASSGKKMTYNSMDFGYLDGDIFEPLDCVKGDVARIIMYVWTTYNTYPGYNNIFITDVFESFDTLLSWHTMDKPDALEGHRNDYVQKETIQKNRNPFVDHPELGWKIFGDQASSTVKANCMAAYPVGGGTPIDPTGITLDKSTASTEVGKSTQLKATLQPYGASGTITWTSNNTSVATVNNSGKVTGVSTGKATITAACGSYSASCSVTVNEAVPINYGTLENPISVAEARAIIDDESPTKEKIYIKGIVTSNTYNSKYSNFDDVYLKDGDNDKGISLFRSVLASDIDTSYNATGSLVGKEVVACGYGEYYSKASKYEISPQNSFVPTIISVKDPSIGEKTAKEQIEAKTTSTSLSYNYTKQSSGTSSVTDTLTKSSTTATSTTYTDWTYSSATSGVTYKGQSATSHNAIQLRSDKSNSGIVTTVNANSNKAACVTVSWNTNTANGRTLNVYGKSVAYTNPTDLYSEDKQGTLLGTIVNGTSTSLTISGNYEYIGVRSNGGAMYLDSLDVQWGSAAATFSYSDVSIRFGGVTEKSLWSKLNEESTITGFGVVIADGEYVNNADDFAAAAKDAVSSTVTTDLSEELAIDYFVPIADMSKMGENGDNYFWNLRQSVTDLKIQYAAAAYIKTTDGCVFMKYAKYSVKTLAVDYINKRGFASNTAGGSLANLTTI